MVKYRLWSCTDDTKTELKRASPGVGPCSFRTSVSENAGVPGSIWAVFGHSLTVALHGSVLKLPNCRMWPDERSTELEISTSMTTIVRVTISSDDVILLYILSS